MAADWRLFSTINEGESQCAKAKNQHSRPAKYQYSGLEEHTIVLIPNGVNPDEYDIISKDVTRILKLGNHVGDAAEVCYIELVDYNANMLTAPKSASDKKKTRRSRSKKVETAAAPEAPAAETPAE